MTSIGYEAIFAAYESQYPAYRSLAERMVELLGTHLGLSGIGYADVTGRAKDPDSFVKKAIRKGYSDPMATIRDKAGVRIVTPFARDRQVIEDAAGEVLELSGRDDKRHDLGANKLGYLGVHFQAVIRPEHLKLSHAHLAGLEAELQIHTKAENAWAVAGHDSMYKAVIPPEPTIARRMMRLIGLAEIFDDEIELFQKQLESQPGYAALQALVPPLEKELFRFSARSSDLGLSGLIVPAVASLYGDNPAAVFSSVLSPYIDEHRQEFMDMYARYESDTRVTPLLFQPEAFMLFERLEKDRFRLKEAWPERLPLELLDKLGSIRGTSLS